MTETQLDQDQIIMNSLQWIQVFKCVYYLHEGVVEKIEIWDSMGYFIWNSEVEGTHSQKKQLTPLYIII